jgi:hypothetical protein
MQRIGAKVEHHRIPIGRGNRLRIFANAATAKVRPRRFGRLVDRVKYRVVGDEFT